MKSIRKRDGRVVDYDISKIENAIAKAMLSLGYGEIKDCKKMAKITELYLIEKFEDKIPSVEDIQDIVESVLMKNGYEDVAKAYILYRRDHEKIRNVKETLLDYKDTVDKYLKLADWRVKENSTVTYSVGGLILSNSGAISANYWLNDVYDKEIGQAHKNADIHIHDLSMLTGYCAGWSLKQLIQEGLGGIPGKITSSPASHLSTLCNQMVNFLGIMQNEWAGAQAFSSFDTYLAPFVKKDNLTYKEVKQCIQSFVYGVNTPSRWGTQAPFTNITLDWVIPADLAELNCIVGGKEQDFKYKDCVKEQAMINKAFIEIMIEGDANGRGFQYPIPTYSITKNFDWSETENNKLLFEMTTKYGTPYFSNYINSDMEPNDVRSMCCRLRLDLRELRKKSGGYFGAGESTGSIGVVTINMPRIAYLSKTEEEFFDRLTHMMDISARSLKVKRETITKLLEAGLYPYTKRYLGSFNNHFSTIGLVGMNEACLNACWLRKDLTTKEAQDFTKKVLNFMREKLSDYQELYGDLYNLEATPAESTSYRLAKHDRQRWSDIITASSDDKTPYYTNSSHLPVGYTEDLFKALDVQDELQTLYTSGTVFHAFLGQKLENWKVTANLVRKIAENYRLPYYTISPTYSICTAHGYITGEHYTCPECGNTTEVYSRITGYYRPVQNWNDGKAQEFKERKEYVLENSKFLNGHLNSCKKDETDCCCAGEKTMLFTTPTCPNCKMAKMLLDKANIPFEVVDATAEIELAKKYGVIKAPTLLINIDGKQLKLENVSDIKKFVEEMAKEGKIC
ncbi:MAG: ribonucleoside triphosphate reductase [Clostridiales bacterium]|nr:ribonucleoside triphosphate reductase [Clostridiales bacterium]